LMVSPGRPGRRLEFPIDDSGVRFDLAEGDFALSIGRGEDLIPGQAEPSTSDKDAPGVRSKSRSAAKPSKASSAKKAKPRKRDQGSGISPDYKDNPY
jgi:hypothetical protein